MTSPKVVKVKWQDLLHPLQVQPDEQTQVVIQTETIPILFVPGIMGSRLKRRQNGKDEWVWDPDRKVKMLTRYGLFVTAAGKQEKILGDKLDGSDLLVEETDADYAEHHAKDVKERVGDAPDLIERGWPGISWSFYGYVLRRLYECEARKTWRDPIPKFFQLPAYAVGYNWTASNLDSGKYLKERIEQIIKKHTDKGETCEQVILVTHSMGGLVSRSACMLHGAASKVLGIIHGVQPVTGAPVAYWRMKAGFERTGGLVGILTAWMLGDDQKEVTALLANIAGGLQLLPNRDYKPDANETQPGRWLEVRGTDGNLEELLPRQDPYEEIYEKRTGLLKLVTDRYLRPGASASRIDDMWAKYLQTLSKAKDFHQTLGLQQHDETHPFYGTGTQNKTVGKVRFVKKPWYPTASVADDGYYEEPEPAEGEEECTGGDYRVFTHEGDHIVALELQQASDGGDGTVPESSGSALKPKGESYGANVASQAYGFPGIEHAQAYSEGASTFFYVFEAINKLCRLKIRRAWSGP